MVQPDVASHPSQQSPRHLSLGCLVQQVLEQLGYEAFEVTVAIQDIVVPLLYQEEHKLSATAVERT